MEDSDKCILCGEEFVSAIHFKRGYVCNKCADQFYDYYFERHFVVRETAALSKKIEEALTKAIKSE